MTVAEVTIHIKALYEARQRGVRDGWVFVHPPNEEVRSGRSLAKQMALGMCLGVPDLIVFSPQGRPHFMEFKSENGTLNEAQEDFQLWAIAAGVRHSVVRSVDEALRVFEFWGALKESPETVTAESVDRSEHLCTN
jgi:VRR-NUC domain